MLCLLLAGGYLRAQLMVNSDYCTIDEANRKYTFNREVTLAQLEGRNSEIFNIPPNITLVEKWTHQDETGVKHHCYTQHVNGAPILNSEVTFREREGILLSATGFFHSDVENLGSVIQQKNALTKLKEQLGPIQYRWDDPDEENELKDRKEDPEATYYPQMELQVLQLDQRIFNSRENYRYFYKAVISAKYHREDSIYTDSIYYIDAQSGDVIKRFSPLMFCFDHHDPPPQKQAAASAPMMPVCNASCLATTVPVHYYGNHSINTAQFLYTLLACSHRLKDNCTGTYLYVQYIGLTPGGNKDYRDNANTWLNGNLGYPDDIEGTSALWSLEMAHDFYRNVLSRNSYDNQYSQLHVLTNAHATSQVDDRTSWHLVNNEMVIGTASNAYESTIDIVAHEVTHGVSDQICFMGQDGGISASDEEGALAEGYGDIFGQAAEHYVAQNYSTNGAAIDDYEHGVTCAIGGLTWQRQRFIHSPKTNGHPDTYGQTNWILPANAIGTKGHHRNSTVLSHWYFILAEGKTGQNDLFHDYCVTAIGKDKATKIAYQSLFNLAGTAKNFAAARQACIDAAIALYGNGSDEVIQTAQAWFAVGVGPAYDGSYRVQNQTNSGTQSFNRNCRVEVENYTNQSPGDVSMTSNTEIAFMPNVNIISGSKLSACILPVCGGAAGMVANPHDAQQTHDAFSSNTGAAPVKEQVKEEANKALQLMVVPNPTNGSFVLTLSNALSFPSSVTIVDVMGKVIAEKQHPSDYQLSFDLGDAAKGIYFVKVNYEDQVVSKRIVKQ